MQYPDKFTVHNVVLKNAMRLIWESLRLPAAQRGNLWEYWSLSQQSNLSKIENCSAASLPICSRMIDWSVSNTYHILTALMWSPSGGLDFIIPTQVRYLIPNSNLYSSTKLYVQSQFHIYKSKYHVGHSTWTVHLIMQAQRDTVLQHMHFIV